MSLDFDFDYHDTAGWKLMEAEESLKAFLRDGSRPKPSSPVSLDALRASQGSRGKDSCNHECSGPEGR